MNSVFALVLGAMLATGAVGVVPVKTFPWYGSPPMDRLAAACAPAKGQPATGLALVMEGLVPLDQLLPNEDSASLIRWQEQFYVKTGGRLDQIETTGITRWFTSGKTLLTVEGNYELVQRDLVARTEVRRIAMEDGVVGMAATAFPTMVLLFTLPDLSHGATAFVQIYDIATGTCSSLPLSYFDSQINAERDSVANDTYQYRIAPGNPEAWEKVPRTDEASSWQRLETVDESRIPTPLDFPRYRSNEEIWTQEEVIAPPLIQEITYQKDLLGSLRNLVEVDPAALPPGEPPAMEVLLLGNDYGPSMEILQRRKDLDDELNDFLRNYLPDSQKLLLVSRDSGDYFLLTECAGGAVYDLFLHRLTEGKPIIAWHNQFRGDAPGFIGPSPDGEYLVFGSIRVAGDPWFHLIRSKDLIEFSMTEQPLAWGPKAGQVAFDPTGRRLAVAAVDGTVWIYDIDPAAARLTLADRIQAIPIVPLGGDADTVSNRATIDQLAWIDSDTLIFGVDGEYAQALSITTRLPRWTVSQDGLEGATALPDRGLAVLWTASQALVLEGRSGMPVNGPLPITLSDDAPAFAAEVTSDGQLRIRAGKESWLRKLPEPKPLSGPSTQKLLARHAGLTVQNGEVLRLPRLPKQVQQEP